MNRDKNNYTVQAFPMSATTFIGIATNKPCAKMVVHTVDDGDVTFHYTSGDVALTGLLAGNDFAVDSSCTGVTSTQRILVG